jgi:heptosyltransferase III
MRILFTKLRHIGDNLLVTPILTATRRKYPHAEIWLVVRRGTEGVLAGCPEIDRLLTTARPEEGRRSWNDFGADVATLAEIARTRFDYAFELGDNDRGRILVAASGAHVRATHESDLGLGPLWRLAFSHIERADRSCLHQVEMDYMTPRAMLGLEPEPPPLRFDPAASRPWSGAEPFLREGYAVLHAATRWESKSWPAERWKRVIDAMLESVPRVVVSCGPAPAEVAEALRLCRGRGDRVVTTAGAASWRQLAWILDRALYYVGVDTAAMHLAAAVRCPVVSLFGQSIPGQFGPWRSPCIMVAPAGRKPGEPATDPGRPVNHRMLAIGVGEVVEATRRAALLRGQPSP